MPSYADVEGIIQALDQALSPADAARAVLRWLGDQHGPAAISLLPEAEIMTGPHQIIEGDVLDWLRSPANWRDWQAARWLLAEETPGPALIVPLRHNQHLFGLLWLYSSAPPDHAVLLLAHELALRLYLLRGENAARRLQELEIMNELSRMLASQLDPEGLWEPLHQQMALLFDTSSLAVGLYDAETGRLTFPLTADEGGRFSLQADEMPLLALHQAVIRHGIALHFRDLPAECERLTALGINPVDVHMQTEEWPARSWLGVPLRSRNNEILGILGIHNPLPDTYDDADLSLLLTIAAQLALALENAQLLEAEQQRRRIASTLMDVSRDVSSTLQYDEVLDRILEQMQRLVPYDSASIMLLTAQTGGQTALIIASTQGFDPHVRGYELVVGPEHPMSLVLESRQPVVLENAQEHPAWELLEGIESPPRVISWLGIPLLVEDNPIGLITLDKLDRGFYSQRHASLAFAVARQTAVAVENARMHAQSRLSMEALEQRNQRLSAIHRVSSMLSSTLDRDEMLTTAARQFIEIFQVDHCSIVLLDRRQTERTLLVEYPPVGVQGMRLLLKQRPFYEQLADGGLISIDDLEASQINGPMRTAWKHAGVVSLLAAPLIARGRLLGSIGLHSMTKKRMFTAWEQETLLTITRQFALAIANADLYEDAIEANRLKSEFLANISHELRTPLNAIIGYSDMLKSGIYGTVNDAQLDRLARVHTGGTQLLALINDVLDLSRIEAGQMQLHLEPVDVVALTEQTLATVTYLAEKKGLALRQELDSDLPKIQADPQRIRQVLTNLLDNAIKFTPEGSVTLEAYPVTVRKRALSGAEWRPPLHLGVPDGKWIALRVIDTGIGIAAEDQVYIFDAFRQVDSSSQREYSGSGLGLAISYRFVRLHEGYMWVDSTPGKGSIFTVLLPYDPLNPISETAELEAVDVDKQLILVLDDDTDDLQLARDYLNTERYHVLGMTNPERAVELAAQLLPAAVIVDVLMPQRSGWDVLHDLKANSQTAHIPVLLWSVSDSHGLDEELKADAYLQKPVKRDTLLRAVTKLIDS